MALAEDVELSEVLKRTKGNCALHSKKSLPCPCVQVFSHKETQHRIWLVFSYLHWRSQINELIMNKLPASTANMLFIQNHTSEYLHNQKYTCSFNYMKITSTKSNRSTMVPHFYFKPHVSFQSPSEHFRCRR